MNSDLEILIDYYEQQKKEIENTIAGALEEEDYLYAHHCQHILYKILKVRNTLNTFKDKNFWQKENIKECVERCKKKLENNPLDIITTNLLVHSQKELENINLKKEDSPDDKTGLFNEFLEKIFIRQIKEFSLILNERKNLIIVFRRSNSNLNLIIVRYKTLLKEYTLYQDDINQLLALGFIAKNDGRLVLTLPFKTKDNLHEVKTTVARIIFEVLNGCPGVSYIKY